MDDATLKESATLIATITQGQVMDAAAIATIGALTTALTQVIKRSVPADIDCYGPLIVALVSLFGVCLWVYSAPQFPPARTDTWAIGAGWVAVYTTAVGVYQTVKMVTNTDGSQATVPVAQHEAIVAAKDQTIALLSQGAGRSGELSPDPIELIIDRAEAERTTRTRTEATRG